MNKENGIIINGKKYVATAGRMCEKCAFGHAQIPVLQLLLRGFCARPFRAK